MLERYRERASNIREDDPLELKIQDAEMLRDLYEKNGKTEEANDLSKQIAAAKRQLKRSQKLKRREAREAAAGKGEQAGGGAASSSKEEIGSSEESVCGREYQQAITCPGKMVELIKT